jgi:hypothetical protein
MIVPTAPPIAEAELQQRIDRLRAIFPEDIARISYRSKPDWTGDPSLFFTVHLTPTGARQDRLTNLVKKFRIALFTEVGSEEFGFHSYVDYTGAPT